MLLKTLLDDILDRATGPEGPAEPRGWTIVAALLLRVAQADGRLRPEEEESIRALLASRFHLAAGETDRLIAKARSAGETLDPTTTLVDRIHQDVAPGEVPGLLSLAYRIAASDGAVHEFEDDLIWRTGRLLGLSDRELAAIKEGALGEGSLTAPASGGAHA